MVKVPENAVWFGLEAEGPSGWERIESEELGGKWWRTASVDPADLVRQLDPQGLGTFRVVFSPTDRRKSLGESLPFSVGADATDDDDGPEPAPAPPSRAPAPPPRPARTQQPGPAGNGSAAPPTPADAMRRHPPQIAPVVPLPPNADYNLMTFWTLQQLAQQQADRLIHMVTVQNQLAIESERSRSREALEQTRTFFESVERNQRQLQAALMAAGKNDQTPVAVHQLQQHIQAQSAALVQLGEKIEELENDDGLDENGQPFQLPSFSDSPNNVERVFAGVQGIVGAIANSPLAEPLGEMLRKQRPQAVQTPPPQTPLPFAYTPPAPAPSSPQESEPQPDDLPSPPPQ